MFNIFYEYNEFLYKMIFKYKLEVVNFKFGLWVGGL